jgi:hypothetical protein
MEQGGRPRFPNHNLPDAIYTCPPLDFVALRLACGYSADRF